LKSLRIFLANLGFTDLLYPQLSPPLGLMYLASYLRTRFKADIRIIDQKAANCSNEHLVSLAYDFKADIIGISTFSRWSHAVGPIIRAFRGKLPGALIVIGGPHVNSFREKALEGTDADAAVIGEGELAFEKIIEAYFENGNLRDVPGIFRKSKSGEIVKNKGTIPLIRDLDSLPMPAYDLINPAYYWRRQSFSKIPRRKYISLFSSRGCPYGCIYCHRNFGNRFRGHSAERVVEEIKFFKKKYKNNDFEFLDDIFNLSPKRLFAFCDLIQKNNLKIKIMFPNGLRADIVTRDSIDALVDAGLSTTSFALETGSPRLQRLIGKNLNISKFLESVKLAVERGVHTHGFAMLGFPTETEKEMQETIDVVCRSKLHTLSSFNVIPFPNTQIYKMALETHPKELKKIRYDFGYVNGTVNLSAVSDKTLFSYQRKANRKFYFNPVRLIRIIKDHPKPMQLPLFLPQVIQRSVNIKFLPTKS
jgi:radical SAM superfamily enzyme YgiQ (UPF0313 family)